jgi:GNAT superfamily N-acetyltransferase
VDSFSKRSGVVSTQIIMRPFADRDYSGAAQVANAVYPDYPWSEAEWRHNDAQYDGGRLKLIRLVAEDQSRRVVAVGEVHHARSVYHPQKLWLELMVHPEFQGRGIGSRLYGSLMGEAAALDTIMLWTSVRETSEAGLRFAARRGFVEKRRAWESRLDVARFSAAPFGERAERALRGGFEVLTAAGLREQDPQWMHSLYEMHEEIVADVPRVDVFTPSTFEEYVRDHIDSPGVLLDAYFVVRHQGRCVAESQLFQSQELPDVLYQGLTGTRREYRGRGLALALKLRTVEYARTAGYREIRTWNDTLNVPMLRINERLGFVRQPAWITMERTVRREPCNAHA